MLRFKLSWHFLDIATIKGKSDVEAKTASKWEGRKVRRKREWRDRERDAPSRDAGGLAGGSALAGRACVNKRPSAVMAVSATSDAFRWLFSPGCLGVA